MKIQIDKNFRKLMIEEMKYALKKMEEAENPHQKLYYFSGIFGVLSRVFNFQYDAKLVFLNCTLQTVHLNIQNKLASIAQGDQTELPTEIFSKLHLYTSHIVERIENKDDDIYDLIQKIVILGYSTTGNGYYLYTKGIIKL